MKKAQVAVVKELDSNVVKLACADQIGEAFFDDDHMATLLHGLAADFPFEPVSFSSIVLAATGADTDSVQSEYRPNTEGGRPA